MVDSSDSPWYAYLAAVYGSAPTLPVRLDRLNYFHHNDLLEQDATGEGTAAPVGPVGPCRRPHNSELACSWEECSRWLSPALLRSPPSPPRRYSVVIPSLFVRRETRSMGSLVFEEPAVRPNRHILDAALPSIAQANQLRGRLTVGGGWREVIRRNHRPEREGVDSYGCWLWPAQGSGIWVSLGRSLILHRKDTAEATLRSSWLSNTSIDHNASRLRMRRLPARERFTVQAADLGYDSVQIQYNFGGGLGQWPEIVLTQSECMFGSQPLGTCLPHSVEVRTGWSAELPCSCDESLPLLNCRKESLTRWQARSWNGPRNVLASTGNERPASAGHHDRAWPRRNACVRKCDVPNGSLVVNRIPFALSRRGEFPQWDWYLDGVYQRAQLYPIELGKFSWFWRSRLPIRVKPAQLTPYCSPATGHAWLGPAGCAAPFPESHPSLYAAGFFVQQFVPGGRTDIPAATAKRGFSNDTWVEVMRVVSPKQFELHGVWYWEARGSGLWWNTGKTFVETTPGRGERWWFETMRVGRLRALGFDSLQLPISDDRRKPMANNRFEMVDLRHAKDPLGRKADVVRACACGLGGVHHLRAGWASLSCPCSDELSLLNCGRLEGGPEAFAAHADLLSAGADEVPCALLNNESALRAVWTRSF